MPSDAKDVGIGKAVPLGRCENLNAAREDRPRTRQSIHRIWQIEASSLVVLRGSYPPQPLTTISNSIYRKVTPVSTMRSDHPARMPGRVALWWSSSAPGQSLDHTAVQHRLDG